MEDVDGLELHKEDLKNAASQIKKQEALLRLKRRWLMGFPLSVSEQHVIQEILPGNDKMIPESFIWKDDSCYEDVRTCVEKAFRVYHHEEDALEEDLQTSVLRKDFRDIFSLLDNMTTEGLCSFIELLTGTATNIKTLTGRSRKTVKEFLSKLITDNSDVSKEKVKKLLEMLKAEKISQSSQVSHVTTTSLEYHVAAQTVMKVLKQLGLRALCAMKRKLQGIKGYVPPLDPLNIGMACDTIARQVKKLLMDMLSGIDKVSEHKERLADAFSVASLALKMMNRPVLHEFRKVSYETEAMQTEMLKAISRLSETKGVSLEELKKVQLLLDPKSITIRRLRGAIRNLLTEYLFECNCLSEIPSYVKEIVEIINSSRVPVRRKKTVLESGHSCPDQFKDVIQKEIECVLTIGAQANEVISDLLPELELDEQFALAYMDESEVSDGLYNSDDDNDETGGVLWPFESNPDYSFGHESIGDMNPSISLSNLSKRAKVGNISLLSPCKRSLSRPLGPLSVSGLSSVEVCGSDSCKKLRVANELHATVEIRVSGSEFPKVSTPETISLHAAKDRGDPMEEMGVSHQQENTTNQYLDIQHACNSTSMVAYDFVGLVLDRLAHSHGIAISQKNRKYLGASVEKEGPRNPPSEADLREIWRSLARL